MLCGYPPFYSESIPALLQSIVTAEFQFHSPYWDHISLLAKDFISHLLTLDPTQRFSSTQALNHPWFS
uniref:Protein kinase domain-containing protein n=1 Tax=Arcella intermedia TaxID=1963864 RepID=A0A6B2LVY8_9EUKA